MLINLNQVWRKLGPFYIFNGPPELHLDFLDLLRLLFFLSLEVEVIDILRVKRLDPFRDYEALLQKLNLFILSVVDRLFAEVQVYL